MSISQTPTYRRWIAMKSRCYNPKHSRYKDWGGKGITVCERWLTSYQNFEADMGLVPSPFHTLDRIDPNGNYSSENCRWATRSEQQRNRRDGRMLTFKDRTLSIYDWAEELGLPPYVLRNRMNLGWPAEQILTTPLKTNYGREGRQLTYEGKTMNISEWARVTGIKFVTIWYRLDQGWPIAKVLGFKEHERKRKQFADK